MTRKRRPARSDSMISLRLDDGSSSGRMPAAANSGSVSSRMRPLDSAMVNIGSDRGKSGDGGPALDQVIGHATDLGADLGQLLLDAIVASVDVVDAVDDRLPPGAEAGRHQAARGAKAGGTDR